MGHFTLADDLIQRAMVRALAEVEWEEAKKKKKKITSLLSLPPVPSRALEVSSPQTSSQDVPQGQPSSQAQRIWVKRPRDGTTKGLPAKKKKASGPILRTTTSCPSDNVPLIHRKNRCLLQPSFPLPEEGPSTSVRRRGYLPRLDALLCLILLSPSSPLCLLR